MYLSCTLLQLIERLRRDLGSTIGLQEDSATNGGDIDSEPEEDDDLGEGSSSKATILSLLGSSGVKGKKTVFVDSAKQGGHTQAVLAHLIQADEGAS